MSSTSKATTLFNLKDEYLKAKSDTNKSVAQGSNNHKKLKDIIHYKKAEKEKRLAEKNAKQRRRAERLALTEKEEQDLANSRSILEAKSAVYDKLLQRDGESSDSILVDFSQKRIDGHEIPFDYKSKANHSNNEDYRERVDDSEPEYDEIHLSHVDKGEIRTKGVGFYSFSKDSETRKQQMDFLNSMRESTERSREIFLATKKKRKQEKLERLNRLRKRLDMTPLTILPNEKSEDNDAVDSNDNENASNSNSKALVDAQDRSSNPNHPSDVTKSIEEKFLIREQTLWEKKVEELRNEREMEFAPVYDTYDSSRAVRTDEDDEDLGEDDDAIVNFISFVRQNT